MNKKYQRNREPVYYVVKKGIEPGIYDNWFDCLRMTKNVKGSLYASFSNMEEAKDYFYDTTKYIDSLHKLSEDSLLAFIDGSFDEYNEVYSWGIVFIRDNDISTGSGIIDNIPSILKMKDKAGKMIAVIQAIETAIKYNEQTLHIYCTYEGLYKFIDGGYKANENYNKRYIEYCLNATNYIDIIFHMVGSHGINKYSKMARNLAIDELDDLEIKLYRINDVE